MSSIFSVDTLKSTYTSLSQEVQDWYHSPSEKWQKTTSSVHTFVQNNAYSLFLWGSSLSNAVLTPHAFFIGFVIGFGGRVLAEQHRDIKHMFNSHPQVVSLMDSLFSAVAAAGSVVATAQSSTSWYVRAMPVGGGIVFGNCAYKWLRTLPSFT